MKVFILGFCLLAAGFGTQAQTYKPFRTAIGVGVVAGGSTSLGFAGTLEPGYRINDRILVGLRGELAGIARGGRDGFSVNVDVTRMTSLTVNAGYYLMDNGVVRLLGGIGAGSFSHSSIEYRLTASGGEEETGTERKFGVYPRLGLEVWHLMLQIDYNIVPKTHGPGGAEFTNNYLLFRFGFFLGGGERSAAR